MMGSIWKVVTRRQVQKHMYAETWSLVDHCRFPRRIFRGQSVFRLVFSLCYWFHEAQVLEVVVYIYYLCCSTSALQTVVPEESIL